MTALRHESHPEGTRQVGQLPVPVDIWQEVVDFLAKRKSGQVILHVKDGHIVLGDVNTRIRPESGKLPCQDS